jgi:hypothetical protein
LKKLLEILLKISIVVVIIFALKSAPALLWPEQNKSLVQDEGYQAGHYTIGINERSVQKDANTLLFSTLKKWHYEWERPVPAPEEIIDENNRLVQITGFMYPLESGSKIKNFCLLRSTQTCCYGPKPQYNQYVLVEMDKAVPFVRLEPVRISGTFYVEPKPEDGYIYRMEGKSLAVATR